MLRAYLLAAVVLFPLNAAVSQTPVNGELNCSKPGTEHRVDALSQPGHAFVLRQGLCRFTKPATIGGSAQVEETYTGVAEIADGVSRWHGRNTSKLANGDLIFVQIECTSQVASDGTETAGRCRWTFVGGTGSVARITGSGSSHQVKDSDPNASWTFTGSYSNTP